MAVDPVWRFAYFTDMPSLPDWVSVPCYMSVAQIVSSASSRFFVGRELSEFRNIRLIILAANYRHQV